VSEFASAASTVERIAYSKALRDCKVRESGPRDQVRGIRYEASEKANAVAM